MSVWSVQKVEKIEEEQVSRGGDHGSQERDDQGGGGGSEEAESENKAGACQGLQEEEGKEIAQS